jgi:surface protein
MNPNKSNFGYYSSFEKKFQNELTIDDYKIKLLEYLSGQLKLDKILIRAMVNNDLAQMDIDFLNKLKLYNVNFIIEKNNNSMELYDISEYKMNSRVVIDISNLDISNILDLSNTFSNMEFFNQNINNWNISKVINMHEIFSNAESFNQPLDKWDTTNIINMSGVFYYCKFFNQNINNWNTSNVADMSNLFSYALSFNQPLNNWNVSNVTNMTRMFNDAKSFNQPLYKWDIVNVTNMESIFDNCISFDQDVSDWNFNKVCRKPWINGLSFDGYNITAKLSKERLIYAIDIIKKCENDKDIYFAKKYVKQFHEADNEWFQIIIKNLKENTDLKNIIMK